tara:strand:+ start:7658 stop:7831 length:174 start_codon:yes stop_codon:yes gene_type:complete
MNVNRQFVYERFSRDINGCSDTKALREIACKFLKLYLYQQEAVESMIYNGWLPENKD